MSKMFILLILIANLLICTLSKPVSEESDEFEKLLKELDENGSKEFDKKYTTQPTSTTKILTPVDIIVYEGARELRETLFQTLTALDSWISDGPRQNAVPIPAYINDYFKFGY